MPITKLQTNLHSLIRAFVIHYQENCDSETLLHSKFYNLASLCILADWLESYKVANSEDRFSCDKAHSIHNLIPDNSKYLLKDIQCIVESFQD